jgi:hypothetical protein
MRRDQVSVQISTADITPALGLLVEQETDFMRHVVTRLDLTAEEPGRLGKLFKPGKLSPVSVQVREPIEPGGAHIWGCTAELPRKIDIGEAFVQVGLDWVPWWAIPDEGLTHLIPKARRLSISGFCWPQVALPWFIRLHAALTGVDPTAPLTLTRTFDVDHFDEDGAPDGLYDMVDEIRDEFREEAFDQHYLAEAYEAWKPREAEWRRQAFPNG